MGYQPVAEDLWLKDKNVSALNIATKFANETEKNISIHSCRNHLWIKA